MVTSSEEAGEEFLEHFGIKGMHWGYRNAKPTATRLSTDSKKTQQHIDKFKTHGVRALTNHELQGLNKRLQLEQSFINLQPKKKSTIKAGHNFVKDALAIGTTVGAVLTFASTPAGKFLTEKLIKKAS